MSYLIQPGIRLISISSPSFLLIRTLLGTHPSPRSLDMIARKLKISPWSVLIFFGLFLSLLADGGRLSLHSAAVRRKSLLGNPGENRNTSWDSENKYIDWAKLRSGTWGINLIPSKKHGRQVSSKLMELSPTSTFYSLLFPVWIPLIMIIIIPLFGRLGVTME